MNCATTNEGEGNKKTQARCLCYSPLGTLSPSSALRKSNTIRRAGDWRAQEGRKQGTRNELRYYERWRKK